MTTDDIIQFLQNKKQIISTHNPNCTELKGVSYDSRNIQNQFVFVAIKGLTVDGNDYISEAIEMGATMIISDKDIKNRIKKVFYLKVKDARKTLALLASYWYGFPSQKLKIIGVTGTKGKTTTVCIIYHILKSLGYKAGMVSTIESEIGNIKQSTGLHVTSQDVISLNKMLSQMVDIGCKYAVIEVSSHGIDQGRVDGIQFEVGVLTNIAPEHLDYHKTMREYRKVKMSFVNSAKYKVFAPKKTDLNILPGSFNNLNVEAAISAVSHIGISRINALKTLKSFNLPEGRLERIENKRGINIYIDFAHTPDSLNTVLKYLREQTKGRLISVFGCAGERDKKKRYKMGVISGGMADVTVITAEDPRSEELVKICRQIKRGVMTSGAKEINNKQSFTLHEKQKTISNKHTFIVIPDRFEAIYYTIKFIAQKGDTVVVCGKGHEKSMCYGDIEHPWSDNMAIMSTLKAENGRTAIVMGAGKGKRLNSNLPKVIHKLAGKPMINYTINSLRKAGFSEIIIVVGYRADLVKREIGNSVSYAYQKYQLGTGHAAWQGMKSVKGSNRPVLVINGDDSAFFKPETLAEIYNLHLKNKSKLTNTSTILSDPTGIGRLVRDVNGKLLRIVEEKVATEEEKKIKESNLNMYVFDRDWFISNIRKVKKAVVGEYYITDMVEIAINQKVRNNIYVLQNPEEWCGVNTPEQLVEADERMREKVSSIMYQV